MSDWLRENKFTVVFMVILIMIAFFSFIKPYIDKKTSDVYDVINAEITMKLDEISKTNSETLVELKKITMSDTLNYEGNE